MASAPDQAPPVDPPPSPDTVDSPLPPSSDVVPTTPSDHPPPLPPPLPPNSPPPAALPPVSPPPPLPVDPPPPPPPRPVDPPQPPPVDSPPPLPVDPPPPLLVVEPPAVSPPEPPVVDPPTISPPQPPPDVVPPTIAPLPSLPPPPPPAVDILSPPPPTDAPSPPAPLTDSPPPTPLTDSPPPAPSISPPPPLEQSPSPVDPPPPPPVDTSPPPPPVVEPPTVSLPPPSPPPVVDPPTISPPPSPPDGVPPTVSPLSPSPPPPPPPPDALSPLPPTDGPPLPAPSTDSPPPTPLFSPPPPSPSPPSPPLSSPAIIPTSPPGTLSLQPNSPPSRSSVSATIVIAAALGSVALLLAVFGLFWFLFFRKKREQDPRGTESHYKRGDGFHGASAQSGQTNYPPSGEHLSSSNGSPFPLASTTSMSNSTENSSSQPQPVSTNGTGGIWSDNSGPDNSFLSSMQGMVLGSGTISFTYDELKIATNGFSSVNLLGQGGFGYVHKGMLQNGKQVAVKSLKADSGQGEREFKAEVETISRVHHKHLVTLVGYCITVSQKLLVYEFVQNKTLEFHLHEKGQPVMDWPTRLKIAIGSAKGLAYLHEDCHPKIIHRDIKAANILLDHTFEAQVADFGLAKFSSDAQTHISTRVMGTFGYLAPEYASTGQLSDKSDVFSFGVLLLELISGRRPVDFTSRAQIEDSLVDWARPLLAKAVQDGNLDALVDPRLENNYNLEEMGAMVTCAASCVRHSAKRRPQLSQVVRALEGNLALADLNDGVKPGFSSFYSSTDLYESPKSEDILRFRKTVFQSGDGNSSDFRPTESELTGGR